MAGDNKVQKIAIDIGYGDTKVMIGDKMNILMMCNYVYEGAIDTECADMYGSDMCNPILDKENFKNIKVK